MGINVSGSWLGTYWQQGQPTRFEMVLAQSKYALSGRAGDDGPLGESFLLGSVSGAQIRFTKRYLLYANHQIIYVGSLTDNQDFMSGQWSLGAYDAGSWEAHRNDNDQMLQKFQQRQKQVSEVFALKL
ncbi:MAG: hypothetical protein AAGG02_10270 [Cyanobacteria bacterium P01_H01_bin.15]